MNEKSLISAYKASIRNKEQIIRSQWCGCFSCCRVFSATEVEDFVLEQSGEQTAICPYCLVDSLIGDASGIELSKELLKSLNKKYF